MFLEIHCMKEFRCDFEISLTPFINLVRLLKRKQNYCEIDTCVINDNEPYM